MSTNTLEATNTNTTTNMRVDEPPLYNVIIYNDIDTHPLFVADILKIVFGKSDEEVEEIIFTAESKGQAIICVCPKDIAISYEMLANKIISRTPYPLKIKAMPQ